MLFIPLQLTLLIESFIHSTLNTVFEVEKKGICTEADNLSIF